MSTCTQPGCTGHLGKFQDCQSEAIWTLSLDGGDAETGTSEFEGHFTLVIVTDTETVLVEGTGLVVVPLGTYIVEDTNSGAVYVHTFDTETEARAKMAEADAAYAKWEQS